MLEIKAVNQEKMANICDGLLTKLLQEERRFDSNVKETYIVKDNYKNKYEKEYNALFLAYQNDIPVGYLFGYWKFEAGDFVYESSAHIDALYVEQQYRHQGIATALMKYFYDWCKERNIKIVEIGVFKENKDALHLYESQQFQTVNYYMRKHMD